MESQEAESGDNVPASPENIDKSKKKKPPPLCFYKYCISRRKGYVLPPAGRFLWAVPKTADRTEWTNFVKKLPPDHLEVDSVDNRSKFRFCCLHFEDRFVVKAHEYMVEDRRVEVSLERWRLTDDAYPTLFDPEDRSQDVEVTATDGSGSNNEGATSQTNASIVVTQGNSLESQGHGINTEKAVVPDETDITSQNSSQAEVADEIQLSDSEDADEEEDGSSSTTLKERKRKQCFQSRKDVPAKCMKTGEDVLEDFEVIDVDSDSETEIPKRALSILGPPPVAQSDNYYRAHNSPIARALPPMPGLSKFRKLIPRTNSNNLPATLSQPLIIVKPPTMSAILPTSLLSNQAPQSPLLLLNGNNNSGIVTQVTSSGLFQSPNTPNRSLTLPPGATPGPALTGQNLLFQIQTQNQQYQSPKESYTNNSNSIRNLNVRGSLTSQAMDMASLVMPTPDWSVNTYAGLYSISETILAQNDFEIIRKSITVTSNNWNMKFSVFAQEIPDYTVEVAAKNVADIQQALKRFDSVPVCRGIYNFESYKNKCPGLYISATDLVQMSIDKNYRSLQCPLLILSSDSGPASSNKTSRILLRNKYRICQMCKSIQKDLQEAGRDSNEELESETPPIQIELD